MNSTRSISQLSAETCAEDAGLQMYQFVMDLYPLCRSITGDGVRETLRRIGDLLPIQTVEVPTGTQVFDWTVPKEWNIRDAYVKNRLGERVVDFQRCNLHVLNYSLPIHTKMPLAELKAHLHTLPEHPDWIPYRTSYYAGRWGFCLTHNQLLALPEEEYEVCIDSSLEDGSLTYGEFYLRGQSSDEILLSCHVCHPSLCNDNLSGVAVATFLAQLLSHVPLRYSYRVLFIPGTIGSITWLARNQEVLSNIHHGLVLTCLGDPGRSTYKRSRRGNAEIDRAVVHVLQHMKEPYEVLDFVPHGYDERQYCSPGINLPVGCLMRTPNGRYPEYHTSADNPDLVKPGALADSLRKLLRVVEVLECNRRFVNLLPNCEPQLGRRGLYPSVGGQWSVESRQLAMLWVLNFSDGQHSLLDIAERSGIEMSILAAAADTLRDGGLLCESTL
jgi:aminopeptidase-like protein